MERITHLILLLSGLCVPSSCDLHYKYVLFKTPKTWYQAQSYCRQNCVDLAIVRYLDEMKAILTVIEGKYDDAVWIGIYSSGTPYWQWLEVNPMPTTRGRPFRILWGSTPVSNCGAYKGSYVYAPPCDLSQKSICFDATAQGLDQYIVNTAPMSWIAALDYCRKNYTNLAIIRDYEEFEIINSLANGEQIWFGLFSDGWVSSDNSYTSFRYWPPEQTVWSNNFGECGAVKNESGRWGSLPCSEAHPFVCKCSSRLRVVKVKFSSQDSLLGLNNPEVQDGILNKIKLKLSENVTDVVQLQWKKNRDNKVFIKDTPDD